MSTLLLTLIPALSGIIAAVGTIMIARWQQKGQQQVFMVSKIDEMVDERVEEIRADRDEIKADLKFGERERKKLSQEISALKESNATLKATISEIQLHREQAINRMRRELNVAIDKNTILFSRNAELQTQNNFLREENKDLREQLYDFQQRRDQSSDSPAV